MLLETMTWAREMLTVRSNSCKSQIVGLEQAIGGVCASRNDSPRHISALAGAIFSRGVSQHGSTSDTSGIIALEALAPFQMGPIIFSQPNHGKRSKHKALDAPILNFAAVCGEFRNMEFRHMLYCRQSPGIDPSSQPFHSIWL